MITGFTLIPNPLIEQELAVDPVFRASMNEVGDEAFSDLQARIPVGETGNLAASARIERLAGGGQRLSVNEDYWLYPEYGTEHMAARPYLRPVLTAMGLDLT